MQKGVDGIMGGALIETSARRLKNEAEKEAKKKTALGMLKMEKYAVEEIAECSALNVEEVEQLVKLQPM